MRVRRDAQECVLLTVFRSFGPCDSPSPGYRSVRGRLELTARISVCLIRNRSLHAYFPLPVDSAWLIGTFGPSAVTRRHGALHRV